MKQRFSSLDVKVIAHELSSTLTSLRLSNAYDLSSRIFLLKFQLPNRREQLLIDSGFRCHLTSFARTTAAAPSAFVARLRKYLKTRRVTSISQIGTDRIIEFSFSDGAYRLFLEFYAGGNIILTDKELKVLALLRRVPAGAGEEEIREGMTYRLEGRQNVDGVPELTASRVRDGLARQMERNKEAVASKKKGKKPGDALRRALVMVVPEFPPALLDHAFRVRQFDSTVAPDEVLGDEEKMQRLMDVLEEAKAQSDEIVKTSPSRGYIIAKPAKAKPNQEKASGEAENGEGEVDKENVALVYEDFHPFRPRQFEGGDTTIIEIVGFNRAVDDFFSSLESQKLESRLTERELHAQRKIDSARQDHEKRIGGLQQVQELNVRKAQALEANIQRVEEATAAVNGLIAQGMDWEDVAKLIESEQARNNPVAKIIKLPLKLEENTITLLLGEEVEDFEDEGFFEDETDSEQSEDEDEDDKENADSKKDGDKTGKDSSLAVDVDLSLTGYANATAYYDQKRTAAMKEEKTAQASEAALKRHEKKVQADLKKGLAQEKAVLRAVRSQLWFEKFLYFISSEGYLILGAKDDTQSDILYNRHLQKGDAWVHADLNHATHVVIKNKPELGNAPIPPSTLAQASSFCVASSNAWDSKAVMGAWWVNAKDVSKLAPNGDYLDAGHFHIKGEKNHLPPAQLLLGFGVMFRLSDNSIARHRRHRVPLGEIAPTTDSKESEQSLEIEKPTSKLEQDGDQDQQPVAEEDDATDDAAENIHEGSVAAADDDPEIDKEHDHEHDSETVEPYRNPLQAGPSVPGSVQDSDDEEPIEQDESTAADSASVTNTSAPSSLQSFKTVLPVRGKHGKKAKQKNKYAWQDEEDRALALQLLGSTKGQEKKQTEVEDKASKAAAEAAAKERRREQHRKAQESGKQAEEARRKRLEGEAPDNDDADGENEATDLKIIDNYVGSPMPGDEIEDVLVVCAPWDAIGAKLRWRVKMQPGSQKKGKAVREILTSWERDIAAREKKRLPAEEDDRFAEEKTLRKEGELIKGLKDVEVVGIVPVKSCRVVIGGASKDTGKGKGKGGGRGGRGSKKAR